MMGVILLTGNIMTDKNLTELILVVDRSGSMNPIKEQASKSINDLVEEQARLDGNLDVTLVQFDSDIEIVHKKKSVSSNIDYTIQPRGTTSLFDAIGTTIKYVGERYANTPEENRPGNVILAIMTDGYENSSREYKHSDIKRMIEEQQNKYSWNIFYLGGTPDAVEIATNMGIRRDTAIAFDPTHYGETVDVLSHSITSYRTTGQAPEFSASDREVVNEPE